jgi:allantoin racemase
LKQNKFLIWSIAPVVEKGTQARELALKRKWSSELTVIETLALPAGPNIVESEYWAAQAIEPMIRIVKKAESSGVNAIIIDCFADPGLEACREATSVPVIGCGQAGMLSTLCLGERIALITENERGSGYIRRNMRKYGYDHHIVYWGQVVPSSNNIQKKPNETRKGLLVACENAAISSECDAILLACTALEPYWEEIKSKFRHDIPVVNPFPCAAKLAELYIALGVSHSGRCYSQENSG